MDLSPQVLQKLIVSVPAILLAITYHEIAHAYVADKMGDPSARMLGRLSPNPLKHIDIFGTVLLPLLLFLGSAGQMIFGYAKPVPVNPLNLRNPKRDMAIVAAAGPGSNFLMALASSILLRILGPFAHPDGIHGLLRVLFDPNTIYKPQGTLELVLFPITLILTYLVLINVLLALFNLFPIPPLDGGRILVGILPHEAAEKVASVERYGFLIVLGILFLDPMGIWSKGFGRLFYFVFGLFIGI